MFKRNKEEEKLLYKDNNMKCLPLLLLDFANLIGLENIEQILRRMGDQWVNLEKDNVTRTNKSEG